MSAHARKIVKCPNCESTVKVSGTAIETCYNCHRVLAVAGQLDTEVEQIEGCNICSQLAQESVCGNSH